MIRNTSELEDGELDYAVAVALGYKVALERRTSGSLRAYTFIDREGERLTALTPYCPSIDGREATAIISLEGISMVLSGGIWTARIDTPGSWKRGFEATATGSTYLIAAMRAFVRLKLGDTVEIPVEAIR